MMASSPVSNNDRSSTSSPGSKQRMLQSNDYGSTRGGRGGSIRELYRKRSSFGGFGVGNSSIFGNLKSTVLDSPTATASATTSSSHGDSSRHSPVTPITPTTPVAMNGGQFNSNNTNTTPTGSVIYHTCSPNRSNYGSPNYSISSSRSSSGGVGTADQYIDHTALLLGFRDEFEEDYSDDEEREWNACFSPKTSLDELDGGGMNNGNNANDHERKMTEMFCNGGFLAKSGGDSGGGNNLDDGKSSTSSDDEGLQLDIASATQKDIPVTYNYEVLSNNAISNDGVQDKGNGNSIDKKKKRRANLPSTSNDEEDNSYYGLPRKNIHSLENKRKSATMKALAMKERASSALVAKATRAKEKVKEKSSQLVHRQHPPAEQQQRRRQPNGMEIITDSDRASEVLSQVSEVSKRFEASGSIHRNTAATTSSLSLVNKKSHFKSKLASVGGRGSMSKLQTSQSLSSISKSKKKTVSGVSSAVNSMKDKASSALSQKASRMVIASSSPLVKQQRKAIAKTQRQVLALASSQSLFSIEDGPTSERGVVQPSPSIGNHNDSARPRLGTIGSNIYTTPKATSRKRGGSLQVIGNIHIDETLKQSNVTTPRESSFHHQGTYSIGSSPLSPPPPITTCPSNVSSTISCIDENGFLISPTTSMDGLMTLDGIVGIGGGASSTAALSTVGSTIGSDDGTTFDPNSFLFLSPLSNADMDDPDYGMPELLSRSNSQNIAAAMDSSATNSCCGPPPPLTNHHHHHNPDGISKSILSLTNNSKSSKLLPRLPPVSSPRLLPPSGKKMIKKMKGGVRNNNNNNIEDDDSGTKVNDMPNNNFSASGIRSFGKHLRPPLVGRHGRSGTAEF